MHHKPITTPAVETLDRRVDRLERHAGELARALRRWRLAAAGMLTAAAMVAIAGAAAGPPEAVEAGSFVLVDEDGEPLGRWLVRDDGTPGLGLFDERGDLRLSLDVAEGGAGVNLYGRDGGVLRAALAIRADGTPALGLFDERGTVARSIEPPRGGAPGRAGEHGRGASPRGPRPGEAGDVPDAGEETDR